jgi:hypothetical protein
MRLILPAVFTTSLLLTLGAAGSSADPLRHATIGQLDGTKRALVVRAEGTLVTVP